MQWKNVNTDLQSFTVISTLLHCNMYFKYLKLLHFLRVPHLYICSGHKSEKLFKGGNYSRAETIRGNTLSLTVDNKTILTV